MLARNTEMNAARSHYLCLTWESTVKIRSNFVREGGDRMLQALIGRETRNVASVFVINDHLKQM